MAAKTVRDLVSGTGTVTVVNGSRRLTFQFNQILKPGTSIQTNLTGTPISFTIQSGALNEWVADQPPNMSGSSMPFNRTDTTTSKARGASGVLVPDATHYVYQSNTADDGNPDCYIYVDTLAPESGIHPYTHDHVVSCQRQCKTPHLR